MPIYEVRYDRDDTKAKSHRKGVVYSEGEYRTVTMVADSEDEALEIAGKRLQKQYPDDVEHEGAARPDLAHSNYKLQGVLKVGG